MLLKISFLLPHLFCNVEFEFSWFNSTKQSSEILILLLEFQNIKAIWQYWKYWVLINDSEFTLDSSDIDLWNIDFLETHLDLLDKDIPSKQSSTRLRRNNFYEDLLKTSSRHVLKTSSRRFEDQ